MSLTSFEAAHARQNTKSSLSRFRYLGYAASRQSLWIQHPIRGDFIFKSANICAVLKMASPGEVQLEILANRILNYERFVEVKDSDSSEFVVAQRNKNTVRKTDGDVKLFMNWLLSAKSERRSLDILPAPELDKYVAMFILSIKKQGGEDYEPDSLIGKFNSIARHLRSTRMGMNLNADSEFRHSREVLAAKCKQLKASGKGNKVNKAEPFSPEDVCKLKATNQLGVGK